MGEKSSFAKVMADKREMMNGKWGRRDMIGSVVLHPSYFLIITIIGPVKLLETWITPVFSEVYVVNERGEDLSWELWRKE